MFGRRLTPSEQAAIVLRERGVIATKVGYVPFPWNTRPVDRYIRVVPEGPFDRAWEGVQRVNELSKVGMLRASMYGTLPVMPMQTTRVKSTRFQRNNAAAFAFGAGPAAAGEQQAYAEAYANQTASPGPLTMFLRRLRGY